MIASQFVAFPQLGAFATLPLRNGTFANNTIVAKFAQTGSIHYLKYTTEAKADKAAQVIDGSVAAQLEAKKNRLELTKQEIEAEKEILAAQLELEKARAELAVFREGTAAEDPGDTETEGSGDAGSTGDDGGS